ncbi:MAG: FHA domain-containing protein, partial [Kofleriaceae bacterium]
MFKLVIQDDEGKTTVVPLIRDEITIGRKEGNTIRLTERNVSRRHARILRSNGEVQIEDLGSYNGIRVNNARIAERVSLRVSDQVQIGDYKLYLKAEGVEQVSDEARTMPIERIDMKTEVGVPPAPPTTPMPVATPPPGTLTQVAGTGAPNRPMAVADTDPAGRPVASAATVAALTTTMGYGKLVIVSSNFAGREFELSRPQMIIGRTDENDFVINHRSISRNHAKVVRSPDNGRYTISDLQSSNGVRVNGQDYGKVELRRGDVVDLGHVRLRYIEPGEDFVFARDAIITDVPEGGGKRGWVVAALLGIAVLGAAGAYFGLTRTRPPVPEVGQTGSGSGSAGGIVATPGDAQVEVAIDATEVAANTPEAIASECEALLKARKWGDLATCGDRLIGAGNRSSGEGYRKMAEAELTAELTVGRMHEALRADAKDAFIVARKEFAQIPNGSDYRALAKAELEKAVKDAEDKYNGLIEAAATERNCPEHKRLQAEAKAREIKVRPSTCRAAAVVVNPPGPGSGAVRPDRPDPPEPRCDAAQAEQYLNSGKDKFAVGQYGEALRQFEKSISCRPGTAVYALAFNTSCKLKNSEKAKYYFKLLSPSQRSLQQTCIAE